MAKKKWTTPSLSVVGISDLDAALSLAGAGRKEHVSHDDVMAFAVTPVDSAEDRIVLVVYPGPKYVYTRTEIENEKLGMASKKLGMAVP